MRYHAALKILITFAVNKAEQFIKISKLLYLLSLESLNGNVASFSENANKLHPFPYFLKVSKDVRALLQGSYICKPNEERALQDPLSFIDSVHFIGAMSNITTQRTLEFADNYFTKLYRFLGTDKTCSSSFIIIYRFY